MFYQPVQAFDEFPGRGLAGVNAEEIAGLSGHDRHRDAGGETTGHRPRDVFDERSHLRQSHDDEDHPGHHGGQQQTAVAVFLDDEQDDGNERRGGAADLHAAAA